MTLNKDLDYTRKHMERLKGRSSQAEKNTKGKGAEARNNWVSSMKDKSWVAGVQQRRQK